MAIAVASSVAEPEKWTMCTPINW